MSALDDLMGSVSEVAGAGNAANIALSSLNRGAKQAGKLTSTVSNGLGYGQVATHGSAGGATGGTGASWNVAGQTGDFAITTDGKIDTPEGTCIVIPPRTSSTGQTRYLGKAPYESIVAMLTGKGDPQNVVVEESRGVPSRKLYTQQSDGSLVVNATGQKFMPNKVAVLSEQEFDAITRGMKNKGAYAFSQQAQGEAENSDNRSWFARNWPWLASALALIGGGLVAFFMARKYKKQAKNQKAQSTTLTTKVTELQNQLNDMKKENEGTDTNTNTNNNGSNTLANNSVKIVGISDTIVGSDAYQSTLYETNNRLS